jgi:hypothetical protein
MRRIDQNTVLLETDEEGKRAEELVRQKPPGEPTQFPTKRPTVVPQLLKEFPAKKSA